MYRQCAPASSSSSSSALTRIIVGALPKEFTTQLNVYVSVNRILGLLVYGGTVKKRVREERNAAETSITSL